jgi:phosphoribosylglycinamide formyltransferase-1
MKKIILFASGSGTNVENIVNYFKANQHIGVLSVFTNNPKAKVIERATRLDIACNIFSKDALYNGTVLSQIEALQPDLIVLAGFLLQFPKNIIAAYPNKIINVHPALLPNYGGKGMYGMHVHQAVFDNKESETGISIHLVNEHYDEGTIIFQAKTNIENCTSPEAIAAKIHELEQAYFPAVIEKFLQTN